MKKKKDSIMGKDQVILQRVKWFCGTAAHTQKNTCPKGRRGLTQAQVSLGERWLKRQGNLIPNRIPAWIQIV